MGWATTKALLVGVGSMSVFRMEKGPGGVARGPSNHKAGTIYMLHSSRATAFFSQECHLLQLEVKKEGPNKGRKFWVCGQDDESQRCGHFEWDNENDGPEAPACDKCGDAAVLRSVKKEGPNEGRYFWTCSQPMDATTRCGFFQWASPMPGAPKCEAGSSYASRCDGATLRTVKKEGPNKGREFWTCPGGQGEGCGLFEWKVTPPSTNIATVHCCAALTSTLPTLGG